MTDGIIERIKKTLNPPFDPNRRLVLKTALIGGPLVLAACKLDGKNTSQEQKDYPGRNLTQSLLSQLDSRATVSIYPGTVTVYPADTQNPVPVKMRAAPLIIDSEASENNIYAKVIGKSIVIENPIVVYAKKDGKAAQYDRPDNLTDWNTFMMGKKDDGFFFIAIDVETIHRMNGLGNKTTASKGEKGVYTYKVNDTVNSISELGMSQWKEIDYASQGRTP